MAYYVRLLTPSEKTVSFNEIAHQGQYIKLVSGMADDWEQIEIYQPQDKLIAVIERHRLSQSDSPASELGEIKDSIGISPPVSARDWLRKYLSTVRTVYSFRLLGDSITKQGWPILGRIQNLLKDNLGGIIQADKEGFYNENGDYILWQIYAGAAGTVPAAVLDESGEWVPFQLRLDDDRAVEEFKQGIAPQRGFLSRLFGRNKS